MRIFSIRNMRFLLLFFLLVAIVIAVAVANFAPRAAKSAPSIVNDKFNAMWEYSDKYVNEVSGAGRGFTWGPNSLKVLQENYQEAPGGKRLVQYFDKSRMELSPDGQIVTNGLLTKELVTGQRQDGNNKFTLLSPSNIPVAGDPNSNGGNPLAPTYASFQKVISFNPGENAVQPQLNQPVTLSINKSGETDNLSNPPTRVLIGYYESTLGHNVPAVFQDYQNLVGQVWNGSFYQKGPVYTDNPTANVFGYPVTEAYWIKANVAGAEKDVLVQLFERRVLTYTPSNPEAFRVEMGNIGQHYLYWRYSGENPLAVWKPTPNQPIHWHWQLSDDFVYPRDVLPNVTVYDIDGEKTSAETVAKLHALSPDIKVICYFDAGVYETYRSDASRFPKSVIGNADEGWDNSYWLDIRQTDILLPIMQDRIQHWCKDKGFDAIEPDETEVWSNDSGFTISKDQNNFYNMKIAELAHTAGLSVGLKGNTTEAPELWQYFDWSLNEQCWEYDECDNLKSSFIDHGKAVFNIEYNVNPVCSTANSWHMNSARRDLNLVNPTSSKYRYSPCVPDSQSSWQLTRSP
jgi:hypothetical protein